MSFIIKKNPNAEELAEIVKAINDNDGYCCCAIVREDDVKCPCKEFRETTSCGPCHCGRFYKIPYNAGRVVLCGSMKFKNRFYEVQKELISQELLVDMPFMGEHDESINELLDNQHLSKIEQANMVYVVDVNGYIGESTQKEIDFATYLNKPIMYDEPPKGVI